MKEKIQNYYQSSREKKILEEKEEVQEKEGKKKVHRHRRIESGTPN